MNMIEVHNYIHIYVYIYVYVHTHIHIHMYTYVSFTCLTSAGLEGLGYGPLPF